MRVGHTHHTAAEDAAQALISLLDDPEAHIVYPSSSNDEGIDAKIISPNHTYIIQAKSTAGSPAVAAAATQLRNYLAHFGEKVVPIIVVPFMGEVGKHICAENKVNWIDLSGNAHVVAPGLKLIIEGKLNRFINIGRPSNLFAPKSSRIVRWLLMNLNTPFTQREIAHRTDMDEGFVSRIMSKLEEARYIYRLGSMVKVVNPNILLDAWRESYSFSKHRIIKGHIPARSGDSLIQFLKDSFNEHNTEYAATGLAAAWAITKFASFRLTTVYLFRQPSPELLNKIQFRDDPRGANVWFVVPNDAGVFHGAKESDGIHCVHPVQVFLDLKEQPERANEAAENLRAEKLDWKEYA